MSKRKTARILAIDPGTRQIGVAVLEGKELVHHGVETIRERRSPHDILLECRHKICRLMANFRPDVLVIEKTFFANNRRVALLNVVADEIKSAGRSKKLQILSFAPSTVKKAACGNGQATKDEVARAVVLQYPELKPYLGQNRKWKDRYQSNRFDAVAIALLAERVKDKAST